MVARKRLIVTSYVHCLSYLDTPKRLELANVMYEFEWEHVKQNCDAWSFDINPLTPELNPSAQRCQTRFFTGDFAF
jgi:hypothetical protein